MVNSHFAPNASSDVYGVAISGSRSPENSYLIDALSVNDPAYGVNASPLTVELIDEVNIITGGTMPEHGRSLGGTVFGAWTPEPGNLPLHQRVPRIEVRSRVFFCRPEQ